MTNARRFGNHCFSRAETATKKQFVGCKFAASSFFANISSMKTFAAALLFSLSLFVSSAADNIQVFFSPKGDCTKAIVHNGVV